MLVAISGSQGSGKSTILNTIEEMGFPIINRKTSRSILEDWDVTLQDVNNDADLTTKFQDEITLRKFNDEKDAIQSDLLHFTERTHADLFTYALVSLGKDNAYGSWLNGYYRTCMKFNQYYHMAFYLRAGSFAVEHDGTRGSNQHYSRMVGSVLALLPLSQDIKHYNRRITTMSGHCKDCECGTECGSTAEHQSPTGEYNYNDYSEKMDDLLFTYDKDFYPLDEDLPDPSQTLQAQASLYCSLDDPNAKGLNLSRLYLLMHDTIKDHLTLDGIKDALETMATKQGSNSAYCKLRFKYPWSQKALRTRLPLTQSEIDAGEYDTLSNGERISRKKIEGHIAYNVTLEGRYTQNSDVPYKFYLTTEYVYSSTCTTTVQFDPANVVWIEDLIELHRRQIPTEVQVVVKRRDEQAFAELNGSNLLFSEDAVRLVYAALEEWVDDDKISDRVRDHARSTRSKHVSIY
jgi:GTP cyclohydrolase I